MEINGLIVPLVPTDGPTGSEGDSRVGKKIQNKNAETNHQVCYLPFPDLPWSAGSYRYLTSAV